MTEKDLLDKWLKLQEQIRDLRSITTQPMSFNEWIEKKLVLGLLEPFGSALQQLQDAIPLLETIVRKEGAFSRDHLTHCENCVELASKNAQKVLEILFGVGVKE